MYQNVLYSGILNMPRKKLKFKYYQKKKSFFFKLINFYFFKMGSILLLFMIFLFTAK